MVTPLRRRCGFVSLLARTAIPITRAVAPIAPVAAVSPIKPVAAPVVAVTITLHPAHHGGRTLFVFLDPNRQIAQHILVETLQPFDLVDRGRRSIEVQKGEMGLAILAQAVRKGFHTPIFGFGDRSAEPFDDALQLRG